MIEWTALNRTVTVDWLFSQVMMVFYDRVNGSKSYSYSWLIIFLYLYFSLLYVTLAAAFWRRTPAKDGRRQDTCQSVGQENSFTGWQKGKDFEKVTGTLAWAEDREPWVVNYFLPRLCALRSAVLWYWLLCTDTASSSDSLVFYAQSTSTVISGQYLQITSVSFQMSCHIPLLTAQPGKIQTDRRPLFEPA